MKPGDSPVSDLSSWSSTDEAGPAANDPGRKPVFSHALPGASDWTAATFSLASAHGAAAVSTQAELQALFDARCTGAHGAVPLARDVGPDFPGGYLVRHVSDRALVLQRFDSYCSPDVEIRKTSGLCVSREPGASAQPYRLYENGQEVHDDARQHQLCAEIRRGLALPPAEPAAHAVPGVSIAERAFQREAGKVFAQRYTGARAAVPWGDSSLPPDARVRHVSSDGLALVLQTRAQFFLHETTKGLVLLQQEDGRFQIREDGAEVTDLMRRDALLGNIRRELGMPEHGHSSAGSSGRRQLGQAMKDYVGSARVELRCGGHRESYVLSMPGAEDLRDHVVKKGGHVFKRDRMLNAEQGGIERSLGLACRYDLAQALLNRFGAGPLSKTVRRILPVNVYSQKSVLERTDTMPTLLTGSTFVDGAPQDKQKASRRMQLLFYLLGATDTVASKSSKILHNVVGTPDGRQYAFDIFGCQEPAKKPSNARWILHSGLGGAAQVAAEFERARARGHRDLDKSVNEYTADEKKAMRQSINRYIDECFARLRDVSG